MTKIINYVKFKNKIKLKKNYHIGLKIKHVAYETLI